MEKCVVQIWLGENLNWKTELEKRVSFELIFDERSSKVNRRRRQLMMILMKSVTRLGDL